MPQWTDSNEQPKRFTVERGTESLRRTAARLEALNFDAIGEQVLEERRELWQRLANTLTTQYERGLLTYREWLRLVTRRDGAIGGG